MKLNIKGLRVSLGLEQDELAIKTGIGLHNLRRLEQNNLRINKRGAKSVMINGDHIDRLCEILQCSVADLILVERVKMKSKRWKRRNRHTRPKCVSAYWLVDALNSAKDPNDNYYWGLAKGTLIRRFAC